jgi:hypothetical protein
MIRQLVAISSIAVSTCVLAADKDPIKEKLLAARAAYDSEAGQVQKQTEDWLKKREETARKDGDKKLLDQTKAERKVYEETGELPKSLPGAVRLKQDRAVKAMDAAYAEAVKEYTRAKKDDEAASVEAAWKAFGGKTGTGTGAGAAVDLLALVDPKTHAVLGEWKKDGKSLVGVNPSFPGVLQLPYEPGEEYDIEATVRRVSGKEYFAFQLVAGGRRVNAAIDTWPSKGFITGLGDINGKGLLDNGTGVKGQVMKPEQDYTVACSVRSGKIELLVDGKVIVSYKGEFDRFSIHSDFRVPDEKALALQIGYTTPYKIDRLVVTPVKGKGTILK